MENKMVQNIINCLKDEQFDSSVNEVKVLLKEIKALGESCTPTELAACLMIELKKLEKKSSENVKNNDKFSKRDQFKYEKVEFTKNEYAQRFFINVGERDGLNKVMLMEFISDNCPSVNKGMFSDSFTKDTYSFFELPKEVVEEVMSNIIGLQFLGRQVNVELSEKKKADRNRGSRGGSRGRNDSRNSRGSSNGGSYNRDRTSSRGSDSRSSNSRSFGSSRGSDSRSSNSRSFGPKRDSNRR